VADQGVKDIRVIVAFHKAEPSVVLMVDLVIPAVDDPHNPAHRLIVPVSCKQESVSIPERLVLLFVKKLPLIHIDWRKPLRFVSVNFFRQIDEITEVLARDYLFDGNFSHGSQVAW